MSANEQATTTAKPKKKAEVENVRMTDGRDVEFAGKRKMLKQAIYDSNGNWIGTQFDFRNGETRTLEAPAEDLKTPDGEVMLHKYAGHGSEQKVGDETAGAESLSDMIDAVDAVIDRLSRGEWYIEGTGAGAAGTSLLLRALVVQQQEKGKEVDLTKLRGWLKTKTPEQKKAMRASDQLRPIVQRLEAEDAAKTAHVDTDALFDELDQAA